jgi:hypothetical protein
MNSQPNSHTHCQAAQANAQTKAWQRVCLSHPDKIELKKSSLPSENKKYAIAQPDTTKTMKRSIDNGLKGLRTRTTGYNSVLPQLAVTCKIEADCYYQTFVQVDSEVLRNPARTPSPKMLPKRQPTKRSK